MQIRTLAATGAVLVAVCPCLLTFTPAAAAQERRAAPQVTGVPLPDPVAAVATEIDAQVQAIQVLTEELDQAMDALAELLANEPQRPDLGASDESMAAWEHQYAEWEAQVTQARSRIEDGTQRLERAQSELDRLRAELEAAETHLDQSSRTLHQKRIAAMKDYADRLKRQVAVLNSALTIANRAALSPGRGLQGYAEAARAVGDVKAAAAAGIPIG